MTSLSLFLFLVCGPKMVGAAFQRSQRWNLGFAARSHFENADSRLILYS